MENIEVAIRIRPINLSELSSNDMDIWDSVNCQAIGIPSDKYNEMLRLRRIVPGQKISYNFNYCYNQLSTNQLIYNQSIKRIALSSLQGINGTIFMYGQTGSGKTFTIMGSKLHNSKPDQLHKKPPLPYESLERTPSSNYKSMKTPNKINSASNIANVQIDLNSLMSETEKYEVESEKGPKKLPIEQFPSYFFDNSEANPMKNFRNTNDCLFNEDENLEGVLLLALKDMFSEMEKQIDKKFFIRCSYLEIYTDLVYDLLKDQDHLFETLTIGEDLNKEFFVKGATDEIVTSVEDILFILRRGEVNRHYASTIMNHNSSRSHTIFRLFLQCIPSEINEGKDIITESVLNFVDLAGSERISIHDHFFQKTREKSVGHHTSSPSNSSNYSTMLKDRVNESKHINKSLFFLTQVISLKSQGKPEIHIPFRNSPLTKILRSSLGGNSRTAIILCVNPCYSQYEQTISTIRFGLNAKKIENQIKRNIITSNNDEIIKNLIQEYEKKINDMEKEKNEDKSRSQNLLNIIESLQAQKTFIEERLVLAKKAEIFNDNSRVKEVLKCKKLRNHVGDYIHYKNIGILNVFSYSDDEKCQLNFDSQGKYAMQGLKLLQEQEKIWAEKEEVSKLEIQSLNEKYKTLIDNYNNLETKLTKKRSKFDQLLKKSEAFSKENQLLCQFFDVLDSKDSEILKKFSLEFITTIEKTLLQCLDTLKLEKFLRNVSINLQTMGLDKYQEVFKATKDNRQLFLDFLRETQARKTEIDLKSLFFKEIAFKPITLSNSVQVEEKNLETSSMCSNFKELLSQINIKSDKNIDSFQTYFEKEHKKDLEISLETDIRPIEEPFESKLAELQRNFLEIKEKIKEKVSFYKDEKPSNEREDDHNEKSFDKIRDNSPMRGFSIQNKENLNFTRGDNNVKNRIIRKNQENQNSIKRNIVNANAFERHLEVLRNNNKN